LSKRPEKNNQPNKPVTAMKMKKSAGFYTGYLKQTWLLASVRYFIIPLAERSKERVYYPSLAGGMDFSLL
jgi:hypothetical protein